MRKRGRGRRGEEAIATSWGGGQENRSYLFWREEKRVQDEGGRISASLGGRRGVGRSWGLSLKGTWDTGDRPGQQMVTPASHLGVIKHIL